MSGLTINGRPVSDDEVCALAMEWGMALVAWERNERHMRWRLEGAEHDGQKLSDEVERYRPQETCRCPACADPEHRDPYCNVLVAMLPFTAWFPNWSSEGTQEVQAP